MIKPSFNPMIGPSPYVLINMGARYVPCMHNVEGVQNANGADYPWNDKKVPWPCPSTTTLDAEAPENRCTLSDLCGFGGVPEPAYIPGTPLDTQPAPNQWFRFIIPIFMHAGLIHIGFNMLLQLTLGRDMEKSIGSIRFFLVYMSAGIFGFVMGGNYAGTAIQSTGASGSLFGIIALTLLDLLYSWKDRVSPVKDLLFILLDIVISFVLGLLPGLDNFSHIGGFLMGLGLGVCLLHSPNSLRRRIGDDVPYASSHVSGGSAAQGTPPSFVRNPVGFFKGRRPLWWAWWLIRAGALVLVTVGFILLLKNFYVDRVTCDWCRYLSCLVSPGCCIPTAFPSLARELVANTVPFLACQGLVRGRERAVIKRLWGVASARGASFKTCQHGNMEATPPRLITHSPLGWSWFELVWEVGFQGGGYNRLTLCIAAAFWDLSLFHLLTTIFFLAFLSPRRFWGSSTRRRENSLCAWLGLMTSRVALAFCLVYPPM